MRKTATTILRILQITETSSYLVESSLTKLHYVSIVLLIAIVTTVSQTAAGTTIAGLDTNSMGVSPIPTPTQTVSPFDAEVPTPTPSPSPDPTVPIPFNAEVLTPSPNPSPTTTTLTPDINTLFKDPTDSRTVFSG